MIAVRNVFVQDQSLCTVPAMQMRTRVLKQHRGFVLFCFVFVFVLSGSSASISSSQIVYSW